MALKKKANLSRSRTRLFHEIDEIPVNSPENGNHSKQVVHEKGKLQNGEVHFFELTNTKKSYL